jgi:hypothetical protein
MLTTSSNHFTEREREERRDQPQPRGHDWGHASQPRIPPCPVPPAPRHGWIATRRRWDHHWLLLYFPGPSSACCRISIWLPCLLHHSSFARVLAGRHVATEGLGSNRFRKQLEDGDRTCIHALLQIHSQELRPTEPVVAPVYVRIWLEDQSLRLVRA